MITFESFVEDGDDLKGVEDAIEGLDELVADLSSAFFVDEYNYDVLITFALYLYLLLLFLLFVVFTFAGLVPHALLYPLQ